MANLAKYQGEINLPDEGMEVIKIIYDFDKDSGAVASYNGFQAGSKMVVHRAVMKIQTAVTTSASGTLSLGKTGSVAALCAVTAAGSMTADAIITGVAGLGAGGVLLAAGDYVLFDIATGALTAGKVEATLFVEKF